ncbi:MAG: hypothetical protein JWR27_2812 [Aeromicrobium sp.]|jgi:hypothetical protein|nr:hypothetical protein [Aeromicrobium sp.]MCW2789603.1 hypothetical protein [Aeromicrobium sp.]
MQTQTRAAAIGLVLTSAVALAVFPPLIAVVALLAMIRLFAAAPLLLRQLCAVLALALLLYAVLVMLDVVDYAYWR